MHSISNLSVQLLYEHLDEIGIQAEKLYGQAKPAGRDGLIDRTPVERWKQMLELGSERSAQEAFGLEVAKCIQLRHLGLFGYVLKNCRTAVEALERLERFHALSSDFNPVQVAIEQGQLILSWPAVHGDPGPIWNDFGIACVVQMARQLTGRTDPPTRVDFTRKPPQDLAPYEEFYNCEIRFQQDCMRLCCPVSYLLLELDGADEALLQELDEQAAETLNALQDSQNQDQQLQEQLISLLHRGRCDLAALADLNHCSERTMQRRLKTQGVLFSDVLAEVREKLAKQYLQDPRLQISDVASLLAYAEQSTFSRAFQDWTGASPGQWRKQNT